MFKYYLMGNVYKDQYIVTNLQKNIKDEEIYSDKPSDTMPNDKNMINYNNYICTDIDKYYFNTTYWSYDDTYRYSIPTNITIITPYKYKLDELNLDKYLEQLKSYNSYYNNNYCYKYENVAHYKKQHKISNQKILNNHVWDRFDVFDTIETDREFRDNEVIKIDNKDYKITYKFNKKLSRHELYVDYDGIFEVDYKLKEKCDQIIEELNFMIDKYNKSIDEMEVVINEKFECYQKPEEPKKSLLSKIKKIFKHE